MADEVVFNQDNSEHKAAEFTWYSPIDGQPLVCAIGLSIMTLVLHPMESKQSPWKAAGRHCLKKHAGIAGWGLHYSAVTQSAGMVRRLLKQSSYSKWLLQTLWIYR